VSDCNLVLNQAYLGEVKYAQANRMGW
jgi:hypothetical protein